MPRMAVEKDYRFDRPGGRVGLVPAVWVALM
jgi:hypothetical protein